MAALREIELGLSADDAARRHARRPEWLFVAGAPLLIAWALLVTTLIAVWVIWDNAAGLILAVTLAVFLPAALAAHRWHRDRRQQ